MHEEADSSDIDQKKKSCTSESLGKYIKLVETEKQNWRDYEKSLKKRYYDLKGDLTSRKKVSCETINFIDYLPEEEKDFLAELQQTLQDSAFIEDGLKNLNDSIYLINIELENQANLAVQKLDIVNNEFETFEDESI